MKELYVICPFITSDELPGPNTSAYWVHQYSYIFTAYSDNLLFLKKYYRMIDELFDNAFTKLGYPIVTYQYPNEIVFYSGRMIEYINEKYELSTHGCELLMEQNLNVFDTENGEYYITDMGMYDSYKSYPREDDDCLELMDIVIDIISLEYMIPFIRDSNTINLLLTIIQKTYLKDLIFAVLEQLGQYDPEIINECGITIYRLRKIVIDSINESKGGDKL